MDDWRFSARVRHYGYDNQIPHTAIPQFINYDTSVKTSSTGGPEPYAHNRTFDADATWTGLRLARDRRLWPQQQRRHDFRIFESTGEDVLRLTADAVGSQWVTFRAQYELADRTAPGWTRPCSSRSASSPRCGTTTSPIAPGTGSPARSTSSPTTCGRSACRPALGKDDYDDSYFGLQESTFRVFSLVAADYRGRRLGGGRLYNYERYSGFQQSRSASPGPGERSAARLDDGLDGARELLLDLRDAAAVRPQHRGRVSYDYSYAEGTYFYAIRPGGPLHAALAASERLQQAAAVAPRREAPADEPVGGDLLVSLRAVPGLRLRVRPDGGQRHRPAELAGPGYVYRPYTAHSFVVGARYFW